jgi:putative intracellular protease/amidase
MSATIDMLDPEHPKRVLMVLANSTVSPTTGWPVGLWWAELTHAYWEFAERGYQVGFASPDGGPVQGDSWSDPRDDSGYSADDLISLAFINSPRHAARLADTARIADVAVADHDAVYFVGGQSPMLTFAEDARVHDLARDFYVAGKVTAVVCHATCILLKTRLPSGDLLVTGKTWTGFANSEENFADAYVGRRIQPFRIEDEATALPDTNFIVSSRFKPHAVRDGLLVTGQQQYSGAAAARIVVGALGV